MKLLSRHHLLGTQLLKILNPADNSRVGSSPVGNSPAVSSRVVNGPAVSSRVDNSPADNTPVVNSRADSDPVGSSREADTWIREPSMSLEKIRYFVLCVNCPEPGSRPGAR